MRVDLNSTVTWEGTASAFQHFLEWWKSELLALVPANLRTKLADQRRIVRFDGELWHIVAPAQPGSGLALDMRAPDAALRDLVARLDPAALIERVDAELPPGEVLTRTVRLPAAGAAELRAIVGLQIVRLSPLPASEVAFDCRKLGAAQDGEIDVEIAIVPKATLARYEARLADIGIAVRRFGVAGTAFRIPVTRLRRTRTETFQLALAGVAILAWLAVLILPSTLRGAEYDSAVANLSALAPQAQRAADFHDEVSRLRVPVETASAELAVPGPLAVLKSLTDLLPQDVVLTALTVSGRDVHIEGSAPDAGRVVAALKASGDYTLASQPAIARTGPALEQFALDLTVTRIAEARP